MNAYVPAQVGIVKFNASYHIERNSIRFIRLNLARRVEIGGRCVHFRLPKDVSLLEAKKLVDDFDEKMSISPSWVHLGTMWIDRRFITVIRPDQTNQATLVGGWHSNNDVDMRNEDVKKVIDDFDIERSSQPLMVSITPNIHVNRNLITAICRTGSATDRKFLRLSDGSRIWLPEGTNLGFVKQTIDEFDAHQGQPSAFVSFCDDVHLDRSIITAVYYQPRTQGVAVVCLRFSLTLPRIISIEEASQTLSDFDSKRERESVV